MVSRSSLSIARKLVCPLSGSSFHCVRKLFPSCQEALCPFYYKTCEVRGGGLELCSAPSVSSIPQSVLPSRAWELLAYPLFFLTMSLAGDEEAEGYRANTGRDDLPAQHRGPPRRWNGGRAMDTAQSRSVASQHRWCTVQAVVTLVCLFITVYWGSSDQDGTWSLQKKTLFYLNFGAAQIKTVPDFT